MKDATFEKYVNLIRKYAHYYAKLWRMEYDDVEAECYLIYTKALKKYDVTKSNFTTFLVWELKQVSGICRRYTKHTADHFEVNDNGVDTLNLIEDKSNQVSLMDMLTIASTELSTLGYEVFQWMLLRTWEDNVKVNAHNKPSIVLAMAEFNLTRKRIMVVWQEIEIFYKNILLSV